MVISGPYEAVSRRYMHFFLIDHFVRLYLCDSPFAEEVDMPFSIGQVK